MSIEQGDIYDDSFEASQESDLGKEIIIPHSGETPKMMYQIRYISEQTGIEEHNVFAELFTLGVNIVGYNECDGGLFRDEHGGYYRRIGIMDPEFDDDPLNNDITEAKVGSDSLLPSYTLSVNEVGRALINKSSMENGIPVDEVARRAIRLATNVFSDIVVNDAEYFIWDYEGGRPYDFENGAIQMTGKQCDLDISFLYSDEQDE